MRNPLLLAALLAVTLVPCVAATDGPPPGWHLAGNRPENYRIGAETNGALFLTSKPDASGAGFGTLMQSVNAEGYRGQRVRFSAIVRAEALANWAGLWMRVDRGTQAVAFDNMHNRPIQGSNEWHTYQVVLEVPPDATSISFGTLIVSRGEVWMEQPKLEVVGADVLTTAPPIQPHELLPSR